MSKRSSSDTDSRAKEWFDAAGRHNFTRVREIFDDGFEIDCRDKRGRTALFYAITPYGGHPELVKWLVMNGADVNVRDNAGETALDFGSGSVSSALEANMIAWAGDLFRQHGYPERTKPREPTPREIAKRKRKLSDYWGTWIIDGGNDDGHQLRLSSRRIESDVRSLQLTVDEAALDERGHLVIHGEHATELVHVTIVLKGDGKAILRWSDGIMGPLPDIRLKRR